MRASDTIRLTSLGNPPTVEEAFSHCEQIARLHYENFPVASLILPKRLRSYVAAVYAFARTADDFADEGNLTDAERLAALADWRANLSACSDGRPEHPVFVALAEVLRSTGVSRQLLDDLITAFEMDVTTHRYASYSDVLYYCQHSANPVGRIVLQLFNQANEENFSLSDHICSALQLTNFWQDISIDKAKGRLYLPLEDLARFGYTESDFDQSINDQRFRDLIQFQVRRTREMFQAGRPLLKRVALPLRFELRLTWNGGITILKKIEENRYNVLHNRPKVTVLDKVMILMQSLLQV